MDKLQAIDLDFFYGANQVLHSISVSVLTVQPEVILMDEPCSALDPITTKA